MTKSVAIIISPNWRDYAKKYLAACIGSIRQQDYDGKKKIFITDNETSPQSAALINSLAPEAELILNPGNDGYAKGVNDAMRLALASGFDYIAVFNIHTVLAPNCLSEMIKVLTADKKIGVVQARQMMPDKETVNSLGNESHFLGFGYCFGYKQKWQDLERLYSRPQDIHYPSGSSMLFSREVLAKIGLLDEEYWMYNEDQEIGWRLWLAGYRVVMAPKAVLFNKYEFQRSIKKFYWMDRNRIITILLCYKLLTLLLVLPAFILMEAGLTLFALKNRWFKDKLRVWGYFLRPKTWIYLFQARKRNQSLRVVKDKDIINLISGKIWYQEIDDWKLRMINPIFNAYWQIVKKIIIW